MTAPSGVLFFMPIFGHDRNLATLSKIISCQRLAPAYLFVGVDGIGKSLVARHFANLILGTPHLDNHPDLLWVEPTYQHQGKLYTQEEAIAQNINRKSSPIIRLEQIREVTDFLTKSAINGSRKVVVIESVGAIAEAGANALLKTLEEPPHTTIILIAPSVEAILPTLTSRCHRIAFHSLSREDMIKALTGANYPHLITDDAILAMAGGSPGTAIAIHNHLKSVPNQLLENLRNLPSSYSEIFKLAGSVAKELALDTQIWVAEYLQYFYWQKTANSCIVSNLEESKKHLKSYAQPRLVWECTLLLLVKSLAIV